MHVKNRRKHITNISIASYREIERHTTSIHVEDEDFIVLDENILLFIHEDSVYACSHKELMLNLGEASDEMNYLKELDSDGKYSVMCKVTDKNTEEGLITIEFAENSFEERDIVFIGNDKSIKDRDLFQLKERINQTTFKCDHIIYPNHLENGRINSYEIGKAYYVTHEAYVRLSSFMK